MALRTAARWRAARDGVEGHLVEPATGELMQAWGLVDDVLRFVGPALTRDGDLQTTNAGRDRLRSAGTGAQRQRRIHRRTGDIHDVLPTCFRDRRCRGAEAANGFCVDSAGAYGAEPE